MAAKGKDAQHKLLTAAEITDYLKIDRSTVYRPAETDRIPHFRVGGDLRFNLDTIDEWRVAQEQASAGRVSAGNRDQRLMKNVARAYWDNMSPDERSAEIKRRATSGERRVREHLA